jgi:hypothetical protein
MKKMVALISSIVILKAVAASASFSCVGNMAITLHKKLSSRAIKLGSRPTILDPKTSDYISVESADFAFLKVYPWLGIDHMRLPFAEEKDFEISFASDRETGWEAVVRHRRTNLSQTMSCVKNIKKLPLKL